MYQGGLDYEYYNILTVSKQNFISNQGTTPPLLTTHPLQALSFPVFKRNEWLQALTSSPYEVY